MRKIIEDNWDEFLKEYWNQECKGCGHHSSFWRTIIQSQEWLDWKKYAWEDKMLYDFTEVEGLGIISEKHFKDFINFTIKYAKRNKRIPKRV